MIPEHLQELLDIAADEVKPALIDQLVVQTKPTASLALNGWHGRHGLLVPRLQNQELPRRVVRIGVVGTGWATVGESITHETTVGAFRTAYGDQPYSSKDVGDVAWALEANACVYFPVTGWNLLPAHMQLSQFDVGHRVVVTRGEAMGAVGHVVAYQEQLDAVQVKLASTGAVVSVAQEALAVLLDDEPEALAPMQLRFPPGTQVWAQVRVRGGQPMGGVRAVATAVSAGRLLVLRQDDGETLQLARDEVVHGDEPEPAVGPVARTAKGYNPAPKLRRKKQWNVPPAKRPGKDHN